MVRAYSTNAGAYRVVSRPAHRSDVTSMELPDLPAVIPVISELRRIVQYQDGPVSGGEPLACGLEVARQDIPFTHAFVRQETIRSLGIGPVLTGHWDTLPSPLRQLLKQRPKPLSQTLVHEGTLLGLLVDPTAWRLSESNSAAASAAGLSPSACSTVYRPYTEVPYVTCYK
jgi:hypothetical protein